MVCEPYKSKLDTYLDRELPEPEMRSFDSHVRSCLSCSAEALGREQLQRSIQIAGRRFTPSAEFRKRIQESLASKPQRNFVLSSFRPGWLLSAAVVICAVFGVFNSHYLGSRSGSDHVFSEIADLHVATLASSSPVDVVSTDRHTVKPWFQGRIPFAFNLPELQNTGFSLQGGRMSYLDQSPGAHLIYDVGKHHISVFVFQDRAVPVSIGKNSSDPQQQSFNVETWRQGGLRYFVIGDASVDDIHRLAELFKQ